MPRMDLYLTDRRDQLLRKGAERAGLTRSSYIGRLLDEDEGMHREPGGEPITGALAEPLPPILQSASREEQPQ